MSRRLTDICEEPAGGASFSLHDGFSRRLHGCSAAEMFLMGAVMAAFLRRPRFSMCSHHLAVQS
jgi:hypothetical protein